MLKFNSRHFTIDLSIVSLSPGYIQKAIGWALREYSKADAGTVIDFVEKNEFSHEER